MARDNPTIERLLNGPAATAALAAQLAPHLVAGDVVALDGELGTGKTTFARALIRALGNSEPVPSPTFTLAQIFETATADVWHFDFYRLRRAEDAFELGIEEAFATAISVIEWPERAQALLPADRLVVQLRYGDAADEREVQITALGTWQARLAKIAAAVA